MKKVRRHPAFELTLEVTDDTFVNPARPGLRGHLFSRVLFEADRDLRHLETIAGSFVAGGPSGFSHDKTDIALTDDEIMEDWQRPLMQSMAEIVSRPDRDVLEVGFGRGVSAEMIQQLGVRSHTIIECNSDVLRRYETWRRSRPEADIRVVAGKWQDVIADLGTFDAVFFHTYPLNEDEYLEYVVNTSTFAEHFFSTAAAHLNEGGVFTYFSGEIDSLSRAHQRDLLTHFSSFQVSIQPLDVSPETRDTWWSNTITLVAAIK